MSPAGSFVPMTVTRLPIGPARPGSGTYPMGSPMRKFHSLIGIDPSQTTWLEHGVVRSRVALLRRSSETEPLFARFVRLDPPSYNLPLHFFTLSATGTLQALLIIMQVLSSIAAAGPSSIGYAGPVSAYMPICAYIGVI